MGNEIIVVRLIWHVGKNKKDVIVIAYVTFSPEL